MRVEVRLYAELNDFLPPERRQQSFAEDVGGGCTVRELLMRLRVPPAEVELVLVNGVTAGLDRVLRPGDRVALYPVFESFDVTPLLRLRPRPLRRLRFLLDAHLGRLARHLRLLGFDAAYDPDAADAELVARARREGRLLLTRDRALLLRREVTHGLWVRANDPAAQVRELVRRLQLERSIRPFRRCLRCNNVLKRVPREAVAGRVPARVASRHRRFHLCPSCGRIYWRGTHYRALRQRLRQWCQGSQGGRMEAAAERR